MNSHLNVKNAGTMLFRLLRSKAKHTARNADRKSRRKEEKNVNQKY